MPSPYRDLRFPDPPADRPYVFLSMIATVDGKTVSGTRDECAIGLGSAVDKATMALLDTCADAVLAGAATVRTASPSWRPAVARRIVVSGTGRFDFAGDFFTQGEPFVVVPEATPVDPPSAVRVLRHGTGTVDLRSLLATLRNEHGVERMLAVGGPSLNGELFRQNLVDEVFLTLAPRIKLGDDLPTLAGGDPLPREAMRRLQLVECHPVKDEVFLRYRL
ncbi:MAG: RibD family protein [Fimbriimonas sp.]